MASTYAYGQAVQQFAGVIKQEVSDFKEHNRNWRLETEDLLQECLIELWRRWGRWSQARNMEAYCRIVVRNCLARYERTLAKDALYRAEDAGSDPETRVAGERRSIAIAQESGERACPRVLPGMRIEKAS